MTLKQTTRTLFYKTPWDVRIATLILIVILASGLMVLYVERHWIPVPPQPELVQLWTPYSPPQATLWLAPVEQTIIVKTLYGLQIDGIERETGEATAAIYVGDGWDCLLTTKEGCIIPVEPK